MDKHKEEMKKFLESHGIKAKELPKGVHPLDYDPGPGNTAYIYHEGKMYEIEGESTGYTKNPFGDD